MAIRRGFTLIELLVTVAIIVVLIAILLPSLTKAREQAKTLKCLSTLRQFAMAANMYADQSNDWIVPAQMTNGPKWIENLLFRQTLNFTNSSWQYPQSFVCSNSFDYQRPVTGNLYNINSTYGINHQGLSGTFQAFKRSTVLDWSSRLLFADANDWQISRWFTNLYTVERPSSWIDSYTEAVAYRHTAASINIAFFDGHAETWKRPQVDRTTASPPQVKIWYPAE